MNLILWIILGALAGAAARRLVGGLEKGGLIASVGIGILGAGLGGFLAAKMGLGGINSFTLESLLIATGGACLALLCINWAIRIFK